MQLSELMLETCKLASEKNLAQSTPILLTLMGCVIYRVQFGGSVGYSEEMAHLNTWLSHSRAILHAIALPFKLSIVKCATHISDDPFVTKQ